MNKKENKNIVKKFEDMIDRKGLLKREGASILGINYHTFCTIRREKHSQESLLKLSIAYLLLERYAGNDFNGILKAMSDDKYNEKIKEFLDA